MSSTRSGRVRAGQSVWERVDPAIRPAPLPLSRERILAAALVVADADGLEAVSLRKVGAALDVGPMRLYGYVATKEELLELMVDVVYGEMVSAGPFEGDWRSASHEVARRLRDSALRHEWFVDLLGGRPHQGPAALQHLEAWVAALHGKPGFERIDDVMLTVRTVGAFVIGAVRSEVGERIAERRGGASKAQWQAADSGYLTRMIATGRFPNLEKVVKEHEAPSPDETFEGGLDCVLRGIAARLGAS